MPTKRQTTKAISRQGINRVREIVEEKNNIFQEIDLENDVGNDAYIEFISDEYATGCCIFVQIKSGNSYGKNGKYKFQADQEHFEYWNSHMLPVCAIIYSPKNQKAMWVDITKYLHENPDLIENGPYVVEANLEFSLETFEAFKNYFLDYRNQYENNNFFERSVEIILESEDGQSWLDAMRALFSFYRNRKSTWFFLCQYFQYVENNEHLNYLTYILSHIPGHGDIWWSDKNLIDQKIRVYAWNLITQSFGEKELRKLLTIFSVDGFERGSLSQSAHALIGNIRNSDETLSLIAFNPKESSSERYAALLLLSYGFNYMEDEEISPSLELLREYLERFPNDEYASIIQDLIITIQEEGYLAFY